VNAFDFISFIPFIPVNSLLLCFYQHSSRFNYKKKFAYYEKKYYNFKIYNKFSLSNIP